jgi:hypothetical protein
MKEAIPSEWTETQRIDSHVVEFAILRRALDSGRTLVVVRAFVPTWRFPNFFGIGAVGHLRADGIVVDQDGRAHPAGQELMWDFR